METITGRDLRGYVAEAACRFALTPDNGAYSSSRYLKGGGIQYFDCSGLRSALGLTPGQVCDYVERGGNNLPIGLITSAANSFGVSPGELHGAFPTGEILEWAFGCGDVSLIQLARDYVLDARFSGQKLLREIPHCFPVNQLHRMALSLYEGELARRKYNGGGECRAVCLHVTRTQKDSNLWEAFVPNAAGRPVDIFKVEFGRRGVPLKKDEGMLPFATDMYPLVAGNLGEISGRIDSGLVRVYKRDNAHTASTEVLNLGGAVL